MGRGREPLSPSVSSLSLFLSLSISLSLSLSYVIHMIHVEPRGAGITLTFCIQHTHKHTLPTNTKEMCPQIPSPRALCTVFVCIYLCVHVCKPLHSLWLFMDVMHVTYIMRKPKKAVETNVYDCFCITLGQMCSQEFLYSIHKTPVPFKPVSQLMEKDSSPDSMFTTNTFFNWQCDL